MEKGPHPVARRGLTNPVQARDLASRLPYRGTPLSHSCLPPEKAVSVLQHLVEGNGVRQTERLVGVHRDTVMRLARKAGEHARDAHNELGAFSLRDP